MSETESTSPAVSSANRIYYCEHCGLRIPPADLHSQRAAIVSETEALCAKCNALHAAPAPSIKPIGHSPSGSNTRIQAVSNTPSAASAYAKTAKRAASASKSSSKNTPLVAALAGAAFVGILLAGFALTRKKAESVAKASSDKPIPSEITKEAPVRKVAVAAPPAQTAPASPPLTQPVPVRVEAEKPAAKLLAAAQDDYDPRKAVAESMLAQAKDFQKKNPDDVFAYRDKLQFLIDRYRTTEAGEEAVKLIAEIKLPSFDPDIHPEPTPEASWATATRMLDAPLRSDRGMWWKKPLPYILPEEYDLRFAFNRFDSNDCFVLLLTRHGKPFLYSMGSGNSWVSFEDIRASRKDLVPTGFHRSGLISNNTTCQIVLQVRKSCLRGYINGKLAIGCQVDDDGLSVKKELLMPNPAQMGILTWNSGFEFSEMEIIPLKGELQVLK